MDGGAGGECRVLEWLVEAGVWDTGRWWQRDTSGALDYTVREHRCEVE